ncbi:MAG: glycosyltransferase family 39 protein [Sphingobacteriales bacterium]|nr:glycosyltransferase family 39 protein [Sphingobacteriales bacterium]
MTASKENKWLYLFISLAAGMNFSGLFVPLLDPDAGIYASISKQMVQSGDYLNLHFQGKDWLDKPHFPFWLTAFFFKIFGISTWSYKLPGILLALTGAGYTYLFARQQYNKTTGLWASFILLCSLHFLASNNDVRAEPFLTGLIIAAVYHFSNSFNKLISWHLLAACVFTAAALMTKGPFSLVPIGGALAGELILKRNWKQLFHPRWLIAFVLLTLFISPELYSLWYQFDSHPEKIIFDKTNVSGIRFFLWDSQFGRFFNTGPIKGKGDPFFFLHTLLWAFLPWALLMYAALYLKIKSAFSKTGRAHSEWYSISGSLPTILMFSLSGFQLPYYTNIIFPFLAILTAAFVMELKEKGVKRTALVQGLITGIVLAGLLALYILYRPAINAVFAFVVLCGLLLLLLLFPWIIKTGLLQQTLLRSGLATLIIAQFLNGLFYPDALQYQSGSQMAYYLNRNLPGLPAASGDLYIPCGQFYLDRPVRILPIDTICKKEFVRPSVVFISEKELILLQQTGSPYELVKAFPEYHITTPTLKFINHKTREKTLKKQWLVKLL